MRRPVNDRLRLGLIYFSVCLVFGVVLLRLGQIQIVKSNAYSAIVEKQSKGTHKVKASRGILYDRNGMVVASNVILKSLYAYPNDEKELNNIAVYLDKFFNLTRGTSKKKFRLAVKRFRWIKRKLPDAQSDIIALNAPPGLTLRKEPKRNYPFGMIGRQIIGFTDVDNKGCSGLELMFDSTLAGQFGKVAIQRDGLRNTFLVEETPIKKPVQGESKLLTVDWRLQEIVEEELRKGVEKYNGRSGMAVFINNNNGQILSMAHYDPNEKYPERPIKLRTVSDLFEPGSIFKIISSAGILEDTLVNYDDTIYCEEGKWKIGRRYLNDDKEHAWLNYRQIIELSSNIGIAKYAIMYGGDNLYKLTEKFHLTGERLLNWPGEARGMVDKPNRWADRPIAMLSIGHGVAVTALQMAASFAAVANGGKLYRPYIIFADIDKKGNPINIVEPDLMGEVMMASTSDTLRKFMRGVVEVGTAEPANSKVITIAGKTGTAQIPNTGSRGYSNSDYMSSFAGFFPAEKPLITGIIVIEAPKPVTYGGHTSGPVFRKIAERYAVLNPDLFAVPERVMAETSNKMENILVVPDLLGRTIQQARSIAEEKGLTLRTNCDDGLISWQYPSPDRLAFDADVISVAVKDIDSGNYYMSDLKGLPIREVSAFMNLTGIKYKIFGNGKVYRQSIKPGTLVDEKVICRLECRPI